MNNTYNAEDGMALAPRAEVSSLASPCCLNACFAYLLNFFLAFTRVLHTKARLDRSLHAFMVCCCLEDKNDRRTLAIISHNFLGPYP